MTQITYPIIFEPLLQENIWGGEYLKKRSHKVPAGPVGESWEISDYKNETTVISNGEYKGKSLYQVIDKIYGSKKNSLSIPERFPLLLKILAPESELSVQVHPTDYYTEQNALKESGKAEAWYILDAPEGSFLYLGLTERLTKEMMKKAVEDKTLIHYLNKVYVKPGDVVNIPHGTIHSLCPHIRVFEIQQSSNITYRLYDWGRVNAEGIGRKLHIREALEVINFDYLPVDHHVTPVTLRADSCLHQRYIKSANFTMEKISRINSSVTLDTEGEQIKIITSLNSRINVKTISGEVTLDKYDSCLIPAAAGKFTIDPESVDSELLLYY